MVTLNISRFRALFEQFSAYADEQLTAYFMRAELYINNTARAIIPNPPREMILYLTMAHLLTLYAPGKDGGAVGRVSSASQGSVNVSLDFPTAVNAAWWNQTQFGAEVWVATAKYRTFRWVSL